jgi:simple sugar transport system permease protein
MALELAVIRRLSKILRRKKILGLLVGLVIAVALLSSLEQSGVKTGSFLNRVMIFATPLIFATLGEIYVERSGVLNLGIEGMMATGAVMGVVGAFAVGSAWAGAALGTLGGALLAFIFAIITVRFHGMQVPAGLGLFMFGLGLSGVIGSAYVGMSLPHRFTTAPIPVLNDIPVLGEFLFRHGPLVYLALILVPVMWFVLFKTRIGLNIRTVGENPAAADSAGVNVFRYRYLCIILGGALAGLGGAFLSVAWTPGWVEGMVAGRGWIVIALTIFALWNPLGALLGSLIFGGAFALQFELQGLGFPVYILGMLPYLVTLIALISAFLFKKRLGAPDALLKPYRRE